MKGFLIAFAAIVALTHARPQGVEFTAKDYAAFQQALGDRIPVAIQSAIRVLATVESNPTDFVVLNFNGVSGPMARTGQVAAAPAPPGGVAIARIGLAAEAEEEEQEEVVAVEEMNDVMAQAVVQAIQEEVRRRKRQNNVDNDDDDDEERVLQANTLALAFSGLGSLYGPTIGRYLDDMFQANLKFIGRLEDNGKIVLDQVDRALENPKDKTKRSLSLFVRK